MKGKPYWRKECEDISKGGKIFEGHRKASQESIGRPVEKPYHSQICLIRGAHLTGRHSLTHVLLIDPPTPYPNSLLVPPLYGI